MILANREKHSISVMCRTLNIPRSLVYYKKKTKTYDTELENAVISIFRDSKNNYGSRKIKIELKKAKYISIKKKNKANYGQIQIIF